MVIIGCMIGRMDIYRVYNRHITGYRCVIVSPSLAHLLHPTGHTLQAVKRICYRPRGHASAVARLDAAR